jgi:uncharacterized membrane protein YvbJ
MADCAACGTRLEEGLTKCPQCGVTLTTPGVNLQALGWVVIAMSLIPLVVGVVTAEQKYYLPMAFGVASFLAGIIIIVIGRARSRAAPPTTRPSAAPAGPPPGGAQPPREARI